MKNNNEIIVYIEQLRKQQRSLMVEAVGHEALSAEEERIVDKMTQNAMLKQWRDEQPLVPANKVLKVIRTVLPNFPDVAPEEVEARTRKQDRARQAYAAGHMLMSKYVPDKAVFNRERTEQRLPMLMTDEERQLYVQHASMLYPSSYKGSDMSNEEISASIQQHEKEKFRVIIGALKRMINQNEQVILDGLDDETLIQRYPDLAVPCALTQEAVTMLTSAMKYTYDEYPNEELRALRDRASAMMDNAVNYEKRVAMMADTYYPHLKLEEFYAAPVSKLMELIDQIDPFNNGLELGFDTNNKAQMKAQMDCFENTYKTPGAICFDLCTAVPSRIAHSLGFESINEVETNCFLCDSDGKRLKVNEIMLELEKDKPLWIVRKDGSGEPVPVMADPSQRTPNALVGKTAIAAATPLPRPASMSMGERIANSFSRFFRRRPTRRKQEYDLQTEAYERSVALRKQAQTVATTPKAIADEHTNLARAAANTPRNIHEAGLEEIMSVLPQTELKPNTIVANRVMATLFVDCAMLDNHNSRYCFTMKDVVEAGKPNFSRENAIDYLSKHPAFQEIATNLLRNDAKLVKAMRDGDKEAVQSMITKYGDTRFAAAFLDKGRKTEPSDEYRREMAAMKAQRDQDNGTLPGHVVSASSANLAIANKGSAVAWDSVMDVYGPNRKFRPDWTSLDGHVVYTIPRWHEIEKSNVNISRFNIEGKPMEAKDFASMAMLLTIRPDIIKKRGDRPDTTPFEDITMAQNMYRPRAGVFQIYNEVMLPSRQLLIDCLDHMNEAVSDRDPKVTGKEMLAAELTTALVAFDNKMKLFDWSNRSQATSCEVALRAYDFAKEHGMLDMMKQKGLTDEQIKRLEVGRVCAKIVNEAMDAEADMISENMGLSTLTAEQRRACIDKMALGMTLQAETIANKVELDVSERPVQLADETSAQFDARMIEWSKKLAKAVENGGNGYKLGEVSYDLLNGGRMLQQLSRHMLSDTDRIKMASSADNHGFNTICASNITTQRNWADEAREVHTMADFMREKIQPLCKDPAAKNFVAAAGQILQTGRPESKRLLVRMTDDMISMTCASMQENPMIDLGRLLESMQSIRPKQPQKEAANNRAVL